MISLQTARISRIAAWFIVIASVVIHSSSTESTAQDTHHEDHDGHAENHPWEWAGVFQVGKGHYDWVASRKNGVYASPSMKILMLSAAGHIASAAELTKLTEQAEKLWPDTSSGRRLSSWTNRSSGGTLAAGIAYNLKFDQQSWLNIFHVNVDAGGAFAIFAEHSPTEFEQDMHYFKNGRGADVEPEHMWQVSAEDHAGHDHGAPAVASTAAPSATNDDWGLVMLGAFLTCTPTLLGIMGVSCAIRPELLGVMKAISPSLDSFASGVLFAAGVFLLLPEALHLCGTGQKEVDQAWTWGTSILLGWVFCVLMHHACSIVFERKQKKEVADSEKGEVLAPSSNWMAIAGPVIFGDFFHNFADGFVIGTAFRNCSGSFAWELIGVTVAHELPQEIVDFFLLVNGAGIRWQWATLANFACSLSTLVGAAITYGADVGNNEQGYILAFGAGVYLFIAMTELGHSVVHMSPSDGPDDQKKDPDIMASLRRLVPFAVGCTAIGLVLLNHEHCISEADKLLAGTPDDPHAGHNH